MNDERGEQTNAELVVIETLIDEHVRVDCNLIQIDHETWAIHGTVAVDGEVIVAEFDSMEEAQSALERIAGAMTWDGPGQLS